LTRLYLLRHGEVTSHRGDVAITSAAEEQAFAVGGLFGGLEQETIRVLCGETRRAKDTAAHLARGVIEAGGSVAGPDVAFALRNPDLYVAGTRINMVSSAEALAEQVPGLSADDVGMLGFFPDFFESPDRIGWWLGHDSPPGEDASSLAARVHSFAASLTDPVPDHGEVVVAVTHSPLIRAVGLDFFGRDIGEPPWLSGVVLEVTREGVGSAGEFVPEIT
jgi:broad specificity phosphatase PhoE